MVLAVRNHKAKFQLTEAYVKIIKVKIELQPAIYVLAVSGGVDSVVLLDLLRQKPELKLIVAHYDHGIRPDSKADRKFVEGLAKKYELPFEFDEGRLGPKSSEVLAREKRYEFLRAVQKKHQAAAIITAHHQDDLLETAIINLLRGTGRRGLSSLDSTHNIKRPLLGIPKKELINYARKHGLKWREDSTNQDEKYLRNWVRRQVISKLTANQRQTLLSSIQQSKVTNQAIETTINKLLATKAQKNQLDRNWFNQLSHDVAKEVMIGWLRAQDISFDRRLIERLVIAAKIYPPGKQTDIIKDVQLKVGREHLALTHHER